MQVGGTSRSDAAAESVAALIGDLAHVVRAMPQRRWGVTAELVIGHHTPPIDSAELSDARSVLQAEAHSLLRTISATAESLSGATATTTADIVESIVERWNELAGRDKRLLVATKPAPNHVIDLRMPHRTASPGFVNPPPPPKRFEFRRLADRLR